MSTDNRENAMPIDKINDVKLQVSLLEKDVQMSAKLVEKISESIEKIQEMNRLDIALYEWVVNRFDWQLKNPSLIKVGSGKRNDIDGIPLWRSVGRSDIREETMLHGAAPQSKQSDINSIFFEEILDVRNHSGMILADVAAFSLKPYQSPESMGPTRLILSPETAKAIIEALEKVLDVN